MVGKNRPQFLPHTMYSHHFGMHRGLVPKLSGPKNPQVFYSTLYNGVAFACNLDTYTCIFGMMSRLFTCLIQCKYSIHSYSVKETDKKKSASVLYGYKHCKPNCIVSEKTQGEQCSSERWEEPNVP